MRRRRGFAWWVAGVFAVAIVGTALVLTIANHGRPWAPLFGQRRFEMPDETMLPTLQKGEGVWVTQLDPTTRSLLKRSAIVVTRDPRDRNKKVIRRVVALSGDTVKASAGQLVLNSKAVDEPYIVVGIPTPDFGPVTVPDGQVWLMGDNRGATVDSRDFGAVKLDDVLYRQS